MARPSRRIDQALLVSGRALFPGAGCAGLSLRAVAEHAGVNVGMFHYHFKSKHNFLRTLLQGMYEEMYAALAGQAAQAGTPVERLRNALIALARFARAHRRVLARVWMDAVAGEPVAREFFRDNAPRHLRLLFGLLEEARAAGLLRELPPLQRFAFMMGSVLMPMVFIAGLVESGVASLVPRRQFDRQVMSDAAIEQRVELVLAALGEGERSVPTTTRRPRSLEGRR